MTRPLSATAPDPDTVLTKAALSAAVHLGVRNRALAQIIGTSEASISRLGAARSIASQSKEGELTLLFLRMFRSLDALVGGDQAKARAWFESDNTHLGGIPAERVRTVEGLVDVVQYLDAVRGRL